MMKYWLVFYADNGGREDCSVYYSWLVQAVDAASAIARVVAVNQFSPGDASLLDAEEKELLV